MSYLRLLFLCQISYSLGSMQVSLGKITIDFARFIMLINIVSLAFTAGLCRLHQYYDGNDQNRPNHWLRSHPEPIIYQCLLRLENAVLGHILHDLANRRVSSNRVVTGRRNQQSGGQSLHNPGHRHATVLSVRHPVGDYYSQYANSHHD